MSAFVFALLPRSTSPEFSPNRPSVRFRRFLSCFVLSQRAVKELAVNEACVSFLFFSPSSSSFLSFSSCRLPPCSAPDMSDDPHTRLVTLLSLLPSLPDAEYHERLLLARDRPLDVSLLGAFALYVHIYGTLPGTDPSGSEQHEGPRDQSYAVNLILQRSQFLAYLFVSRLFLHNSGRM